MWRHVDIVLTDISVESIASIFRVEKRKAPAHAGSFFFSSILRMEAIRFSETSFTTITTRLLFS
jgi:hypothetical protein